MALSLEDAQNQLCFCLRENAAIIYWSHEIQGFDYLLLSDKQRFRGETRNLRKYYRDGCITSSFAGESIDINGTLLYPIKVMYRQDMQCVVYFLLCMHGEMSDLDKTPYFFVRESKRDEALGWLTREQHS